jgi:hypothetical protein
VREEHISAPPPYRSHPLILPLCLLVRSVGIRDNEEDGLGTLSGRHHFTVIDLFTILVIREKWT